MVRFQERHGIMQSHILDAKKYDELKKPSKTLTATHSNSRKVKHQRNHQERPENSCSNGPLEFKQADKDSGHSKRMPRNHLEVAP